MYHVRTAPRHDSSPHLKGLAESTQLSVQRQSASLFLVYSSGYNKGMMVAFMYVLYECA